MKSSPEIVQVTICKASSKSLWFLTESGKNAVLLRSYIASIRRKKKKYLYSQASILAFEEVWLMYNAEVCYILQGDERDPNRQTERQREFCA